MVNKKPKLCAVCKVEIPKGLRKYCSPKCELEAKKARDKAKKQRLVDGKIKTWKRSRWKEEAKKQCQLYVRLLYADDNGYCKCVTCPTKDHYKNMDGGHFVKAHNSGATFNLKVIRPQCKRCNGFLDGNEGQYAIYYMKEEGMTVDEVEDMRIEALQVTRYSIQDYQDIYLHYKELVKQIKLEKGLD